MAGHRSRRPRAFVSVVVCGALVAGWMTVGAVAETAEPTLYRIFLQTGGDLVSVGGYARVDDRVVFSLPLDLRREAPRTHLVTIPAAVVDWTTTDRYADAVRADRYAVTRGEHDFARMSADVARVLNEIAFADADRPRIPLAEATKRRLLTWSETHYGYRADDILEIVSLLDAAIGPWSATDSSSSLDLSLVATTERTRDVPLLPDPTPREVVARALVVSGLTPVAAERISLLRATVAILTQPDDAADVAWRHGLLSEASAELETELAVDESYARLRRTALAQATAHAKEADVRGVQSVLDTVRERDAELGHRRPDHLTALREGLEARLEEARALRLDRDQRQLHAAAVRAYERDVADIISAFDARRAKLDDIRLLAGPEAGDLPRLSTEYSHTASRLARVAPPAEVEGLHRLIRQALALAGSAARRRYQAVQDGDLRVAWDAASAAAGALMLFDRAAEELDRALVR